MKHWKSTIGNMGNNVGKQRWETHLDVCGQGSGEQETGQVEVSVRGVNRVELREAVVRWS